MAVIASAAIPAVLPPVPWQDREPMDGGVANNTPISHAIALGARAFLQDGGAELPPIRMHMHRHATTEVRTRARPTLRDHATG